MDEIAVQPDVPLAELFAALLEARRGEGLPADAQQLFSGGAVRILELKAVHRRLCEATDALREAASDAKTTLDQSSLQLQNLLYERQHYEKEIGSCRGWQSAYSDEQVRAAAAVRCIAVPACMHASAAAARVCEPHAAQHTGRQARPRLRLLASRMLHSTRGSKHGLGCHPPATQRHRHPAPPPSAIRPLPQIALVPLEEFAAHPLVVEQLLAEERDPHQLMLNRLRHEVAYRCGGGGGPLHAVALCLPRCALRPPACPHLVSRTCAPAIRSPPPPPTNPAGKSL